MLNADKKSVCDTCTHENKGSVLSEAEARIHKDNYPDHNVSDIDALEEKE